MQPEEATTCNGDDDEGGTKCRRAPEKSAPRRRRRTGLAGFPIEPLNRVPDRATEPGFAHPADRRQTCPRALRLLSPSARDRPQAAARTPAVFVAPGAPSRLPSDCSSLLFGKKNQKCARSRRHREMGFRDDCVVRAAMPLPRMFTPITLGGLQ